jgi:Kef-type K+ transport system membrane component KefB
VDINNSLAAGCTSSVVSCAAPSSTHAVEQTLFFVLLQLIIIILVARVAGHLARKVRQPRAVGEIVAGLILGPSLFGNLFPALFSQIFQSVPSLPMSMLSQIGLILLMFQIGMDFDFSHLTARDNRRAVMWIAVGCITLPFGLGVAIGELSAPYLSPGVPILPYSLFVGTALSITAVPILGRIMMEYNMTHTRIGAITISAAALNDVFSWILLAVISALSMAEFSLERTLLQLGMLVVYLLICWFVVRPGLHALIARYRLNEESGIPGTLLAVMLVCVFASGMATFKLGIFAIFGGFMLGVLVHDRPGFVNAWKKTVGGFVLVFFLPIFFTFTGLRTNIAGLDTGNLWFWCVVFCGVAIFGKVFGAYAGAIAAGLNKHQAGTIGVLMNTRALMELIVLNVGYDAGFISSNVFTILVIVALVTTVMTGPALRNQLPKMGHEIPIGVDA